MIIFRIGLTRDTFIAFLVVFVLFKRALTVPREKSNICAGRAPREFKRKGRHEFYLRASLLAAAPKRPRIARKHANNCIPAFSLHKGDQEARANEKSAWQESNWRLEESDSAEDREILCFAQTKNYSRRLMKKARANERRKEINCAFTRIIQTRAYE
jgi:hypothetical protein